MPVMLREQNREKGMGGKKRGRGEPREMRKVKPKGCISTYRV
jgi:hypothetical protein